jgi:hypothetical protein
MADIRTDPEPHPTTNQYQPIHLPGMFNGRLKNHCSAHGMADKNGFSQFHPLYEAYEPTAIFGNCGAACSMTVPMAWKIQADCVYSSIQTSALILPDHSIATGSVNKNYATPLWSYAIDSGQVVNCSSIDFQCWHIAL